MRQDPPSRWLFTTDQINPILASLLHKVPRDVGVVIRMRQIDHATARRLVRLCRYRGHRVLLAGPMHLALASRADGVHVGRLPPGARSLPRNRRLRWISAAARSQPEVVRARRSRADLLFLSPAFPTASHPGLPALGPLRFAALARRFGGPVIALGGMTEARARRLSSCGADGWAAIRHWQPLTAPATQM